METLIREKITTAMPYYRNRNYRYKSRKKDGLAEARQHIREAKELSGLLGGTDQTVKKYLFNLPNDELTVVLKEYGGIYSEQAEEYARETIPRWASGKVQMSGMVAERLYKLLPPRMPLSTKFEIAEELWRHVGPSSHKVLRFGETASYSQLATTIEDYITDVVDNYTIPDSLQNRFDWLAGNDIEVKQQLLNHLQNLDKRLVIQAATVQAKSMLEHLSSDKSGFTQLYSHTVEVGKHQLQLIADHQIEGRRLENYSRPTISRSGENIKSGYLFGFIPPWVVLVIGAFILFRLLGLVN